MSDLVPAHDPEIVAAIPAEVLEHDCGCGSAWRWAREGETVIDLGCGSGKTCFLLSRIVGRSGRVIGVDASAAMIAVAQRHQDEVAEAVGWANVRFVEARIHDLGAIGSAGALIASGSVDLAVLDCVLTFVQARERAGILAATARALRAGGRVLVSDVLRDDLEGLVPLLAGAGFEEIEVVERSDEVRRAIGGVPRFATTVRAYRHERSKLGSKEGRLLLPLGVVVTTVLVALLANWCLSFLPIVLPQVRWALIIITLVLLYACMIPAWYRRPGRRRLRARERGSMR